MSRFVADVPDVAVKPFQGKMLSHWSARSKVGVFLVAVAVYVYFLIFLKTIYLKSQRLDKIAVMAMDTEAMLHEVHSIDRSLAAKIEYLESISGDN